MPAPRLRHRDDSLIGQVVAANVVLVTLTLIAASMVGRLDGSGDEWRLLVLALVIVLTFCVNLWMLQRRFAPLERLVESIERVDPAEPSTFEITGDHVDEIDRLAASFHRLLQRVDEERRRSGQLVLRAQEEERKRVARDLHDEVNQALTAILLRLEALAQDTPERAAEVAELKRLASQAMDELLSLARQLRPTALDDHGLVPAIEAQLRGFGERTGIAARLETCGDPSQLDSDAQTVIYRVTQEALNNAAQHAGASHVDVRLLAAADGARLHVRDDGAGFDPAQRRPGGLGLEGMAERARLAGGHLDLRSFPGSGTELTLRLP
jgi:two-component system sensor histidine kinase UhpB